MTEPTPTLFCLPPFAEGDKDKLLDFVESTVLGSIITATPDAGIQVNQIPFTVHRNGSNGNTLQCHFPKANEVQLAALLNNPTKHAVIAFHGANHYVSANWFPSKHKTHRQVPTWNYATVNVTVKIKRSTQAGEGFQKSNTTEAQNDPAHAANIQHREFLKAHLTQLSDYCEELVGEERPWSLNDAPAEFLDILMKDLCGIEFEIVNIEGKMKVNQNKPEDAHGVVAALDTLVKNPEKYKNVTNAGSQCPLQMRDMVRNKGLGVTGAAASEVCEDRCPVTGADCNGGAMAICPVKMVTGVLSNAWVLWGTIAVLGGLLYQKNLP